MMKNIPFEVHPTDGGGVIEAPGYYCGKEEEAQPLSGFDLLMFNETHMPEFLPTFEPEVFEALVDQITVESNNCLNFRLKNSMEIRETV